MYANENERMFLTNADVSHIDSLAKREAIRLVNEFAMVQIWNDDDFDYKSAKDSALLSIKYLLDTDQVKYWESVKIEIEKL